MNAYHVQWIPYSRAKLAAAWLSANNRNAITRAQHVIDQALAKDPKAAGRELSEGLWRIERLPLVAFYEIDDANKTVTVTDIAYFP